MHKYLTFLNVKSQFYKNLASDLVVLHNNMKYMPGSIYGRLIHMDFMRKNGNDMVVILANIFLIY